MFPGTRGLATASSAATPRKMSTPTTTIHDQSRMVLQPIAIPPAIAPATTVSNSRTYSPVISRFPLSAAPPAPLVSAMLARVANVNANEPKLRSEPGVAD